MHLHWCVHFNFVCMHLRWGNGARALHIQVEHILGEGQRSPNWKQLAVLFLPPMVSWIVDRHQRHVGCCPDTCFEHTPFQMLIKSILSWGIFSTSLICENNLIRTRLNIIGFVRFVSVQPTDKACCQFFQPWRCLEWSVDNSCKLHCASTYSRIVYLKHEGSTVWSSECLSTN